MEIQKLELVDDRFPALFSGEKTNTVRWNEGPISEGYLMYYASKNPKWKALIWVTRSVYMPLNEISGLYAMTPEQLHQAMLRHYPEIKIDTEILLVEHLTPQETKEVYGIPVLLEGEVVTRESELYHGDRGL